MEMRSDRHFLVCPKKRPDIWDLQRGNNLIYDHQVAALNFAWIEPPVTGPNPMGELSFKSSMVMSNKV